MLTIFQAIILGLVQGIGEFLPISSTAHLVLVPYFFNWPDPGLSFDVALHVGTLLAVLAFFWRDWLNIFGTTYKNLKTNGLRNWKSDMLFLLVIGTIPGAVFGVLLESKAETIFRSPIVIACTLILAGIILYWADKKFKDGKDLKEVNLKDALWIGLAQTVAIIPGISRSGATITAGLARKLNKISAARFSFLLSTPIIAGAALVKLPHLFKGGFNIPLVVGILVSAVSGFLAIKYLLRFLEKRGYAIFFWYRLLLGLVIMLTVLLR